MPQRATLAEAEYAERHARQQLEDAAHAVLAADLSRLLAEARSTPEALVRRRVVLRHVLHSCTRRDDPATAEARGFLLNASEPPSTLGGPLFQDWDRHPAAEPWRRAKEALLRDADAALPD